jgi:hypothetical protein
MKRADRTVCIILLAIALAVLNILYGFIVVRVSGSSMEPTFKDGRVVYINDVLVDSLTNSSDNNYRKYTQVPDDYIYILGDNRDESTDSRNYGCVCAEQLAGIVFFDF